jgi:hypothetical protein
MRSAVTAQPASDAAQPQSKCEGNLDATDPRLSSFEASSLRHIDLDADAVTDVITRAQCPS